MNYLYRYIDLADNVIKYVGIVCRCTEDALWKRIEEHSKNDMWCFDKTWRIEYIEMPTRNDVYSLESHFIAKWETYKWFNKAKQHFGLLSFIKDDFEWKVAENELFVCQKEVVKKDKYMVGDFWLGLMRLRFDSFVAKALIFQSR